MSIPRTATATLHLTAASPFRLGLEPHIAAGRIFSRAPTTTTSTLTIGRAGSPHYHHPWRHSPPPPKLDRRQFTVDVVTAVSGTVILTSLAGIAFDAQKKVQQEIIV